MLEPIRRTAPPLAGPVVAAQEWRRAAFLHWWVEPAEVAPLLPAGTRPDTYGGATAVGLIAFDLERARIAPFGPVPFAGSFVEVNVRLYAVDDAGRRGVVFRSLEASRWLAVAAARTLYGIPYRWARTVHEVDDGLHRYASRRHLGPGSSRIAIRADPTRTVDDDAADFLTARWALFQGRRGRTRWMPNRHGPWMLHPAELVELDDELVGLAGLPGIADRIPDSVLFSPGVRAEFGRPVPLGRSAAPARSRSR